MEPSWIRSAALTFVGCLLICFGIGIRSLRKSTARPAPLDFQVEGTGFTQCECTAHACPCRSNGRPTHGECETADFAYIKRGFYGGIKLDGLKVVVVGDLLDVNPDRIRATIYFDESTTAPQRAAFMSIFEYIFQWRPARMRLVPIRFRESGGGAEYTLNIPGILEERAVMERDSSGKPVNTVPAMDEWGNAIHYVDNIVFKYHDAAVGESWDLSGRQGNVKYFHSTKAMYDNQELLAQHGDMSGTWTVKQREIILRAGMKVQ